MSNQTETIGDNLDILIEDARALINATMDVAGDKVGEARKRLSAALESAKEIGDSFREQAKAKTQAADEVVRENPYQAIAIGVGAGALLGYYLGRRCSRG